MSFLTEAFHKITTCRKTPAAQTIFNPRRSSSTVDPTSSAADMGPRLHNQCVQPQVGMYSVLTINDHLDVVVRFEQSLPYILPDEDCPQVTYVVPRQDMKVGDSFTLFVEREHFLVKVVQFLLKSDPSSHDSPKDSDSSAISNASRRRSEVQPLKSSPNMHSRPLSPSTGRRQDRVAPLPPSPQPISKPVTKLPLVTPRPNRGDETVFCTRTRADDEKTQNTTRGKAPVIPVVTSSSRPSDKIHRANPSNKHDTISGLDINISVQATTTPLSPLTNIQPSRRLEMPLPPKHGVIMNTEFQAPFPTLDSSVVVQAEYGTRREHVLSGPSIKKTQETNRESSRLHTSSAGIRDLRNISRGYEIGTMENSSLTDDVTIPKSSMIPQEGSRSRCPAQSQISKKRY